MAPESASSTQYDKIGTKYNTMWDLPAVQAERPSVVAALGDIKGARCLDLACGTGRYTHLLHTLGASSVTGYDISTAMIEGAKSSYPSTQYPSLHFEVADCSEPLPPSDLFDIIFAGWFLDYASTSAELTSMFRGISFNLSPTARFIGITTNVHDLQMKEDKVGFYGLDVEVLDREYKDPETGEELGITVRVKALGGVGVQFDCFQFKKEVYEGAAREAGLVVRWRALVAPDMDAEGRRYEAGYWDRCLRGRRLWLWRLRKCREGVSSELFDCRLTWGAKATDGLG